MVAATGLGLGHVGDPFVHLRTVSSHSLRHGVSTPEELVAVAADLGQSALALTDRDGLYGAVLFAQACQGAGIAPILGVDLGISDAVEGSGGHRDVQPPKRSPVRGGALIDEPPFRAVVFARGEQGWAALCRLVSAAHAHHRGHPRVTPTQLSEYAAQGDLVVLLGADSDVGSAAGRRERALAQHRLLRWRALLGPAAIRVELASHLTRDAATAPLSDSPRINRSASAAARLWSVAQQCGVAAVLTNAVRYATPEQAPIADVLDAVRRLVPIAARHTDTNNAEAFLKSWSQLRPVVEQITTADSPTAVEQLLDQTLALAQACMLDPITDMGLGEIHVPELALGGDRHAPPGGGVPGMLAGFATRRRSAADIAQEAQVAQHMLRARCEEALDRRYVDSTVAEQRLHHELEIIAQLGFAGYFLTVAEVVDLIKSMGIRVAARGSGAGSLVNHLLGISGVDPIAHNLLMERFLSPLRRSLPDIDVDVESARRTEVYERIFAHFGSQRCACVSMRETYRVRHAIRDVGSALGFPPGEISAFATAFPHVRARDVRAALVDLPELRDSGIGRLAQRGELSGFLDLVESLDGLPRHVALHPCGVVLSDQTLLDRTPVEHSALGFPMSQFDKDEVESMGFLKLDVLGIRMQSALQHAVAETQRVEQVEIELDEVPLDDADTFELIQSTRTLGCFQIESPGQRELIGKFGPETFDDIITDISLFRPGPVKSDMITPFLAARHGWSASDYLHDDLRPVLAETHGVVVYHEQVLRIIAIFTGCDHAVADEARRALGTPEGQQRVRGWFYERAHQRDYPLAAIERVWEVLRAFASFGFCKAHAAAFALPTYHSAWLKRHHPAAFFAGVLTHDPGMYPKRLILDDARQYGVPVLPVDVNYSDADYRVERCGDELGIRLALAEVKGITDAEIERICAARPFLDLPDFWRRSVVSRPVAENLVLVGAFDGMYGLRLPGNQLTRRDLLLHLAEQDRRSTVGPTSSGVQLGLDLDDTPQVSPSGLPEMSATERIHSELAVLGMDVSAHVIDSYRPMLEQVGLTWSKSLLRCRSRQEILVAGVKVATQTPPIRTGNRVIFLTLDDGTGPVDATFFPDVQTDYSHTVFHNWLLLVRGTVRRTGARGVSIRATGCWDLMEIQRAWSARGSQAVWEILDQSPRPTATAPTPAGRMHAYSGGFRKSPYADIGQAGADVANARGIAQEAPVKLWHSSPGSSGR